MLSVRVLGGVTAESDGRTMLAPASSRAQALLGWLALHPGLHSRADVASRLWPDVVDASARQSMRSAIWSLRRSLDLLDPDALVTTRERIGLRDGAQVDALAFRAFVANGELVAAADLATGDLLAGLDDEWALVARDEHGRAVVELLAALADEESDPQTAVMWARRAATLDPLSEDASRVLMSALVSAGDRAAALAVYQKLAERLRRELRIAPSEPTWRLAEQIRTAVPAMPSVPTRPGLLPLVGREHELALLHGAWTAARAGHGGMALVHGDPGIGKTRLVTQLAALATHGGAVVASGTATDLASTPMSVWIEVCAGLVRRLGELPDAPWVRVLAPMLPAYIPTTGPTSMPGLEQGQVFEAVVALLAECTRGAPVLVVIEDLHAADEASLALLAYVARRLPESRILLVATRRERPLSDRALLLEQANRQSGTTRADLALGPLDREAISALASAVGTLSEDAIGQIVDAADGNALLATECARALVAGESLPVGLRGAVRAALARIDPQARELVRSLAVAGREVGLRELAENAGIDVDVVLPPAEDEGFVTCVEDRVRFRHPLLRDAVYADMPAHERIARHSRAARALSDDPARAAEAAAHLRAAGQLHDAGALLLAAAAQARSLGAMSEATELLREACTALPDDPKPAMDLADILAWRGRPADAATAFETAIALLEKLGDAAALAEAYLRYAEWHHGPICQPRVAVDACRRALTIMDGAGVDAPHLRSQVFAIYAFCAAIGADLTEVEIALTNLRELVGEEPDDLVVACAAQRARCFSLLRQGRFEDAVAAGVRAGESALLAGRPDLAYAGLGNAAFGLAATNDQPGALALLDRALAALHGQGMIAIEGLVQTYRVWVLARMDRLPEAAEAGAQARRCADRLDAPDLRATVDAELGRVALRAGDFRRAVDLLSAALAEPSANIGRPLARLQRAEALARLGEPDAAEAELGEVVLEPVRPGDWPDTLVARLSAVEGLIAAARGDRDLAARRLRAAADGWQRRLSPAELGQRVTDVMADLGRPIIGLVVPIEELAAVAADLARVTERAGA